MKESKFYINFSQFYNDIIFISTEIKKFIIYNLLEKYMYLAFIIMIVVYFMENSMSFIFTIAPFVCSILIRYGLYNYNKK